MPKRHQTAPALLAPIQPPLRVATVWLVRVFAELNAGRYNRSRIVWPDRSGRALRIRRWDCFDTKRYRRLDPYLDPGAAHKTLTALLRARHRRGEQDRPG